MLDESGRLLQGVAKGARKPGGSFASRLETYSEVDVLMAKGRSIDVVSEARVLGTMPHRASIEQSACAAPVAELLCAVLQPDLPQPRIFDMSKAAFDRMLSPGAQAGDALVIAASSLWKIMSQVGFRPSLTSCASCGAPLSFSEDSNVLFSVEEGGVFCGDCHRPGGAFWAEANVILWCATFIGMRFDEVLESGVDAETCFSSLHLARQWSRVHAGRDLRSLDFLFTAGLF